VPPQSTSCLGSSEQWRHGYWFRFPDRQRPWLRSRTTVGLSCKMARTMVIHWRWPPLRRAHDPPPWYRAPQVTDHLIEYVQGLEVLRATRQVGSKSARLQASLMDLKEKQMSGNRLGTIPNILMSTIVQIDIFVVIMLAVLFCWEGTLEVHVLLAIIVITVRFAEPLSIFASKSFNDGVWDPFNIVIPTMNLVTSSAHILPSDSLSVSGEESHSFHIDRARPFSLSHSNCSNRTLLSCRQFSSSVLIDAALAMS